MKEVSGAPDFAVEVAFYRFVLTGGLPAFTEPWAQTAILAGTSSSLPQRPFPPPCCPAALRGYTAPSWRGLKEAALEAPDPSTTEPESEWQDLLLHGPHGLLTRGPLG